ncbi:MAG TPA: acetate uptake transporter [Sphingomonas sp.]|uniref:acetate uptake transporter n=1 Tax=Sphingomonas sp. TaxID=28214 RepID=UPI002BD342B8|nr:acetate uptake transporter [Sphingomonas sp.]HMI18731.1 acetate uptake transporter [Sphingomonas sp.]
MADTKVTVAPVANPAALGLVAFGLTTVLLSLINAGVLPPGGEPVVIPLALAFGGLMQIFAGAFEFRLGNTFGMTAFLSYGAFWWWFALLLLLAGNHWIDISAAGPTVGVALLLWGVLTLYLWISTFRLPKVLFLIFLTLWVTFGLLGIGAIQHHPGLSHLGGWLGLVCGSLALYASFGIITNETFGRTVVPLGAKPFLS